MLYKIMKQDKHGSYAVSLLDTWESTTRMLENLKRSYTRENMVIESDGSGFTVFVADKPVKYSLADELENIIYDLTPPIERRKGFKVIHGGKA